MDPNYYQYQNQTFLISYLENHLGQLDMPKHEDMKMEEAIKYAKKLGITLLDKEGKKKTLKQLTKEIHAHTKKQY